MQVITSDIIDSTNIPLAQKQKLKEVLDEFSGQSNGKYEYFIRGDSFQILLKHDALYEILSIKTLLKSRLNLLCRAAIGIGKINVLDEKLSNSEGPAFRLSGHGLDAMKVSGKRLSIHTEKERLNAEWYVHTATLDYLETHLTQSQAAVLYWQLKGKTQHEIAKEIGISQSAVNRRLKASGWGLIRLILTRYDQTLNLL